MCLTVDVGYLWAKNPYDLGPIERLSELEVPDACAHVAGSDLNPLPPLKPPLLLFSTCVSLFSILSTLITDIEVLSGIDIAIAAISTYCLTSGVSKGWNETTDSVVHRYLNHSQTRACSHSTPIVWSL